MSFTRMGNRRRSMSGIDNEFILGHGEFEQPVKVSYWTVVLVPEDNELKS